MSFNDGLKYTGGTAITPADATDIGVSSNGLMVNVAGDVKLSFRGAPTVFITLTLLASVPYQLGNIYSIESTGTDADGIHVLR